MTRARAVLAFLAIVTAVAVPRGIAAQEAERTIESYTYNPALRILRDYTLRQGDTARQVVVIGGNARIEGHVSEDLVVILGKVDLGSTAVVDGSFVSVAGTVDVAEGAKVNRDFVVIGDAQTPAAFQPGGEHVVIGLGGFGDSLRALVPWLTHGLLLGRPIVPWLGWVWLVAGIFFFLNLCLNLIFDGPVRSAAVTLKTTPFSSFIAGLLVLLLFGPVCVLLAISVIGVAVIPFVLCALLAAAVLGRIAFARWLGMSLFPQADLEDRAQSTRSFVIGSAVMCVAYMIPFIGFVVWILAGVFGLGAATLAFYASYRRENPRPPKKAAVPPPAPVGSAPLDTAPIVPAIPVEMSAPQAEAPLPLQAEAAEVSFTPATALGSFAKGTFVERLAALTLDAIIIMIVVQFFDVDHYGGPSGRLAMLLALAYHVGFWTWRGTTPGGMICQLRVVRVDGKPLEFAEALVRGLTGIISLVVVGLGFLWMLRDPERQTWHDRVAGTYVVKVPRTYPI